jgi:hypothetical protein
VPREQQEARRLSYFIECDTINDSGDGQGHFLSKLIGFVIHSMVPIVIQAVYTSTHAQTFSMPRYGQLIIQKMANIVDGSLRLASQM